MLTARAEESDRVAGLELGADDYVVKPFSPRELAARVNGVLRRANGRSTVAPGPLVYGELMIEPLSRQVTLDGQNVEMTPKEFDVLAFLASSPRQVFSRAQLLESVWQSSPEWQDPATVTVHVRRIRNKIEIDPETPTLDQHGVGRRVSIRAMSDKIPRSPVNRLGLRFLAAMLAVLGVAIVMIALAAQSMFINDHDLRLLMWALVPAVLGAAIVAVLMARPVARDANRICDAAIRVADGDLTARTGVTRSDELGDAAAMFDVMVDRLDAIERERSLMLSSISHDLRTPLTALRASVEAIRDGVAADPDQYLSGMERQVRALSALVDDLQLHSRLISGTMELHRNRLDLTELADEAMETVRPIATARNIALLLEATRRVLVDADGPQLARVVRNLLENAIRHAPDGSVVLVQIDERDGFATLRVVDQGPGFPTDFKDHAFEPFTRADPARDTRTGTAGLGLSIALGIVTAHGGSIAVGDGPGGVVELLLPI